MKSSRFLFGYVLLASLMLQSCNCFTNKVREAFDIRIENSMVDNVYQHVNMDYFHDFMDKQTVEDLIKYHGEPDSIFDAYEETTIEGYDIYEYRYDDGKINCYIPNTEGTRKIVDYIYFEPKKDLKITDVVKDAGLIKQIQDSKATVYYIVDNMRVFVRLRIDKKDNTKIGNIALNDESFLEDKYPLENFVTDYKSQLPIEYGQLGNWTGIEINHDTLSLSFVQEDIKESAFLSEIDKVKDIDKKLIVYLFGPTGNMNHLVDDIINESASVSFDIMTKQSSIHRHYSMSNTEFARLFKEGISSNDLLTACLAVNNLSCPIAIKYDKDNSFEVGGPYVTDSVVTYPIVFEMENDKVKKAIKLNFLQGLTNVENPDRMILYHAVRDNKSLTVDFIDDRTKEHDQVVLSREKTKELYQSLKAQSQKE